MDDDWLADERPGMRSNGPWTGADFVNLCQGHVPIGELFNNKRLNYYANIEEIGSSTHVEIAVRGALSRYLSLRGVSNAL